MIDDIQEELRREDLMQQFKKKLPWILAAVAAILLSAAGYTFLKSWQESQLAWFESFYASALESAHQKKEKEATSMLKRVAQECSGLRFAALMSLSSMEQNKIKDNSKNIEKKLSDGNIPNAPKNNRNLARIFLLNSDKELLSHFKDADFCRFLSLCRMFLDVHMGSHFFGPSPLSNDNALLSTTHSDHSKMETLQGWSDKERTNILSMYSSSPVWKPLSMALHVLFLPKGTEQQKALQEWSTVYQNFLGRFGSLPLYALMGTVEDISDDF